MWNIWNEYSFSETTDWLNEIIEHTIASAWTKHFKKNWNKKPIAVDSFFDRLIKMTLQGWMQIKKINDDEMSFLFIFLNPFLLEKKPYRYVI